MPASVYANDFWATDLWAPDLWTGLDIASVGSLTVLTANLTVLTVIEG